MADPLAKLEDSKEFASEFDRMRIHDAVPKNATATEPRRKTEQSVRVVEEFTLPWDEFAAMSKQDVWDKYVKEAARRLTIRCKNTAQHGCGMKFFRSNLPVSTMNRKVITFDQNGPTFDIN